MINLKYSVGNYAYFLGEIKRIEGVTERLRPDCGYFHIEGIKNPQKGIHLSPIEITEDVIKELTGKSFFGNEVKFIKKEDGRHGYKYSICYADYNFIIERDFNKHQSHFFGVEYTDCPNEDDNYKVHYFAFDVKFLHHLQNLFESITQNELILNYNKS